MKDQKESELFLTVQCLDKDENLRTLYIFEFTFETIKAKSVKEKDSYGFLGDIIFDFQADSVDDVIKEIERKIEFKVIAIKTPESEEFKPYID